MTNGAAVFECGTVGYQNSANYCCENGIDSKTACCSTSSLLFQLAAGTPTGGTPSSPSSTSSTKAVTTKSSATTSSKTANDNQQTSSGSNTAVSATSGSTGSGSAPSATGSNASGSGTGSSSNSGSTGAQPAVSAVADGSGTSQTTKIAVGVAVPVAALILALLGFLIWNNHRNSKKIRDLQAGLNKQNSPPGTGPGIAMSNSELPGSSHGTYANEYYKPSPYTRPMHELGGEGRPYELDQSNQLQRPFELDGGAYRD
jgi:hypothetical protein